MFLFDPVSQLLLQLVTILVAARILGALSTRAGQPAVIALTGPLLNVADRWRASLAAAKEPVNASPADT